MSALSTPFSPQKLYLTNRRHLFLSMQATPPALRSLYIRYYTSSSHSLPALDVLHENYRMAPSVHCLILQLIILVCVETRIYNLL